MYIFSNIATYFRKINERKEIIKKYEELWSKIRNLTRSITENSDYYDGKSIKTKFNSDDEQLQHKLIQTHSMIIVVKATFYENNKCYSQNFLHECLFKL